VNILLPIVLIAALQAGAALPEVSITGAVTDTASKGIGNARVYLKQYPELFTVTDSTGAFSFQAASPVNVLPLSRAVSGAVIRGKQIFFTSVGTGHAINFDLYRLSGEKIVSLQSTTSNTLELPKTAQGLYLARIAINNEIRFAKLAIANDSRLLSLTLQSPHTNAGLPVQQAAVMNDSLIIVAPGFRNAQKSIASYSEKGIAVTLTVSHPWRAMSYPDMTDTMALILAKGYDFEMGQPDPDIGGKGKSASEQGVHTVRFTHDFWMDMTEVTQLDYSTIMTEAYSDYAAPQWTAKYGKGDAYPAYNISWADAALYCNARSKHEQLDTMYVYTAISGASGTLNRALTGVTVDMTKTGYRLPTEAEWEYACKSGTFTDFYWERNRDNYPATFLDTLEVNSYEVWKALSWDKGATSSDFGTHPVGEKIHNYYHLYDMAGNVSEYCNDVAADSYSYAEVTDPVGPASGTTHVIRGGNWASDADMLRSVSRSFSPPDSAGFFTGFRTVKRIP